MPKELLNDENQADSAPPLEDVQSGDTVPEFIQYRGGNGQVMVEDFNIVFSTEERANRIAHKPLPVVTEEQAREGDTPANAVVLPVAAELVRTNPLIGFGVACEECGKVFADREALDGHRSSHSGDTTTDEEADQ